jgi:MYXO-CTERM domain-containing protein
VVDITYSGIASGSWLTGIYAGQGDVLSFGNGALSSWNMQSNIGPITGTGVFNAQNIFTTAGALRFSGTTTVTFTSTVVPAPGAIALVGLAGLAGSRRRRA